MKPRLKISRKGADGWELLVQRAGVLCGILTILLPVLGYRRTSRKPIRQLADGQEKITTWPGMAISAVVYLVFGILAWRPLPLQWRKERRKRATTLGAALYFSGLYLYWWGYYTLDDLFRPSSSRRADLFQDHELRVRGPYAIVRHPMYLGVLMAAAGALLIYRTWAMLLYAPSALVVVARAQQEEAALAAAFGPKWEAYQARVPGWIPSLGSILKHP